MKIIKLITDLFPKIEKELSNVFIFELISCDFSFLHRFHFSLGLLIRNKYIGCNIVLFNEFVKIGIIHEDDMSAFIIELFYIYCKEKYCN